MSIKTTAASDDHPEWPKESIPFVMVCIQIGHSTSAPPPASPSRAGPPLALYKAVRRKVACQT